MNQQELATVHAALAILDSHLKQPAAAIDSPASVRAYLRLALEAEDREVFLVMFLDTQLGVIASEPMFYGTINQASVYPREVARRALLLNATALIVAHNHPSGNATPSEADKRLTALLKAALNLLDIRLLDHFVIGAGRMTSFNEAGLL